MMSEAAGSGKRRSLETVAPPPRMTECRHCHRQVEVKLVYTTPYREFGFRRVTAQCLECNGLLFWDEKLGNGKDDE